LRDRTLLQHQHRNVAKLDGERIGDAVHGVLAVVLGVQSPTLLLSGTPTLTTITIDGNMSDWSAVRADPDNVILDGPAGGLSDADTPSSAALDLEEFDFEATEINETLIRDLESATSSIISVTSS